MKKRIAVVSSYNTTCGIAYYAERLVAHLEKYYDVTVFPVDVELTREYRAFAKNAGDRHIKSIAKAIKEGNFDAVNLQLEPGLYGRTLATSVKRLNWLFSSISCKLVLSVHWFELPRLSISEIVGSLWTKKINQVLHKIALSYLVKRFWRSVKRKNNVSVITFNNRNNELLQNLLGGSKSVFTYPLTYFSTEEKKAIIDGADTDALKKRYNLKKEDIVVSFAGFLSSYKGVGTILRALKNLPNHFKAIIGSGSNISVGGVQLFTPIHTYADFLKKMVRELNLEDRVIWTGTLSNDEVSNLVAASDVFVLPYLETYQAASGPGVLGIELAKRFATTHVKAFDEMAIYYPGRMLQFDVGNHMQLAQLLKTINFSSPSSDVFNLPYDMSGRVGLYRQCIEGSISHS